MNAKVDLTNNKDGELIGTVNSIHHCLQYIFQPNSATLNTNEIGN